MRMREILCIKQDALANALGITQQTVSKLETKAYVEDETLVKIAQFFQVPIESIKNYKDSVAPQIVAETFNVISNDNAQSMVNLLMSGQVHYTTGNTEAIVSLYEKLLAEKDQQIGLLQRLLSGKAG